MHYNTLHKIFLDTLILHSLKFVNNTIYKYIFTNAIILTAQLIKAIMFAEYANILLLSVSFSNSLPANANALPNNSKKYCNSAI